MGNGLTPKENKSPEVSEEAAGELTETVAESWLAKAAKNKMREIALKHAGGSTDKLQELLVAPDGKNALDYDQAPRRLEGEGGGQIRFNKSCQTKLTKSLDS